MNISTSEMATQGARKTYRVPATRPDLVWDKKRRTRVYATLLKGHPPGLFWVWRVTREDKTLLILDGKQRLAAVLLLFDISPPLHSGQPDDLPNERVQFHPDTRQFRIVDRYPAAPRATSASSMANAAQWMDPSELLQLGDTDADEHIDQMIESLPDAHTVDKDMTAHRRRSLTALHRISKVEIPVREVRGSLSEVIELFQDINRGAALMSPEDAVLSVVAG